MYVVVGMYTRAFLDSQCQHTHRRVFKQQTTCLKYRHQSTVYVQHRAFKHTKDMPEIPLLICSMYAVSISLLWCHRVHCDCHQSAECVQHWSSWRRSAGMRHQSQCHHMHCWLSLICSMCAASIISPPCSLPIAPLAYSIAVLVLVTPVSVHLNQYVCSIDRISPISNPLV